MPKLASQHRSVAKSESRQPCSSSQPSDNITFFEGELDRACTAQPSEKDPTTQKNTRLLQHSAANLPCQADLTLTDQVRCEGRPFKKCTVSSKMDKLSTIHQPTPAKQFE
jgi:hypothetical protein